MFDKDEIKNNLTIEQVEAYVAELGGEPQQGRGCLMCKTICHHDDADAASHKLYYYPNTHLFKCFTHCEPSSFDIFDLTLKVKSRNNPSFSFGNAIQYVANYFNISSFSFVGEDFQLPDWKIFDKIKGVERTSYSSGQLGTYKDDILKYLPQPLIQDWLDEGISKEVMDEAGIRFDPITDSIIIPHYNINNELIGIRRRTLIKEEEKYGKYLPAILNGTMYNHPLSFALYNLNLSKENIKVAQAAVIYESEKSCLKHRTFFGADNDISVACCGSNLILHQANILKDLGVKEFIIAFDKQWQNVGDEEYHIWTKKLTEINNKYKDDFLVSFVFDKQNEYLGYKDSPIDRGGEVFLKLFKERIYL